MMVSREKSTRGLTNQMRWTYAMCLMIAAGMFGASAAYADDDFSNKKETIHRCLLTIYKSQHREAETAGEYRALIAMSPGDGQIHCDYGNYLVNQNNLKDAVAQYRSAVKISPRTSAFQGNLGNCLMRMQDYQGALAAYKVAVECQTAGGASWITQYNTAQTYLQKKREIDQYNKQIKERNEANQ